MILCYILLIVFGDCIVMLKMKISMDAEFALKFGEPGP
jgi:hypothetical protein